MYLANHTPKMNKSDKLVDGKTFESKTAKSKTTENRKINQSKSNTEMRFVVDVPFLIYKAQHARTM